MTQKLTFHVKEIVYENKNTETIVVTPQQWAGRMRRKGYKKSIIIKKELATISINIKTKTK